MPLNESKRKTRERWPLSFDLEGIPRDTATRTQLLQQQQILESFEKEQSMSPVPATKNSFATDIQQETVVDINDPKVARYGTKQNPFREFPKMVYHHALGHVLVVQNEQQHAAAKRRGFDDKPANHRDYSKVKSGMVAPIAEKGPEREHVLTNEEIEHMEADELAALEPENQQSEADAEKEIASALGETADPLAESNDVGSRRRKR